MSTLPLRAICGARAFSLFLQRTAPLSSSPQEPKPPADRSSAPKPKGTVDPHAADEQRALEHEQAKAAAEDAAFGKEGARVVPASPHKKSRMAEFVEPEMKATAKEMAEARLPLRYRDYCAHMLIPLNKCRHRSMYLPWKCEEERHAYEKCEYEDFMRRSKMLAQIKDSQ